MKNMAPDKSVASPCIDVCVLNTDDVCIGCYRTAVEITEWTGLDDRDRAKVVAETARRRREDGAVL